MMKRLLTLLAALMLLCVPGSSLAAPRAVTSLDELPETNDEGFLPEGEDPVYYKDHKGGYWYYVDQNVRVEITRTQTASPCLTYYLAELVLAKGSSLYTVTYNVDKPGRTNGLPQDMAAREHVVYAQSGDFYSYRVSKDRYPGNIVRDGKVLYKKSYSKLVDAIPNLATMGFFPSGKAEVNEAWEMSAQEYVERGATTVVAFGPILIRDGVLADVDKDEYNHNEPRSCIGIIEPGHYVGLLVEGRKAHSDGADLTTCAALLYDMGCTDAINLDGGNTAAMLFMGESVQLSNNGGIDVNDRAIPDILCVGRY
ncbi:MAG: phosphodiester glycosidase family protein [Aristaeellaceae bacterium]